VPSFFSPSSHHCDLFTATARLFSFPPPFSHLKCQGWREERYPPRFSFFAFFPVSFCTLALPTLTDKVSFLSARCSAYVKVIWPSDSPPFLPYVRRRWMSFAPHFFFLRKVEDEWTAPESRPSGYVPFSFFLVVSESPAVFSRFFHPSDQ